MGTRADLAAVRGYAYPATHLTPRAHPCGLRVGAPRWTLLRTTEVGGLMDTMSHAASIRLFLARESLVKEWLRRVRGDALIPSARTLEPFRLRDYVPRFIECTTEMLRAALYDGKNRERAAHFARVHALERIDACFMLEEVMREFDHLEAVLSEHLVRGTAAHGLMVQALDEARDVADAAYAGQSGTRWNEPTTVTMPTVKAAEAMEDPNAADVTTATCRVGS
jgi:hypothetical protein